MFCGSTNPQSAYQAALDVAADHARALGHVVSRAVPVADIPILHLEAVNSPPPPVAQLRDQFEKADGVLIAAPEYGGGVAGGVKNALEWMVGSGSLYRRPAAVLSAGTTGGPNAIEQLARTLTWQGASVVATVSIPAPRTVSDAEGRLVAAATVAEVERAVDRLVGAVVAEDATLISLVDETVRDLGIDPSDRTRGPSQRVNRSPTSPRPDV